MTQEVTLQVGMQAPAFSLPDEQGSVHSLSDYAGKRVVIYFYPKDDTPGCTTEACEFRDSYTMMQKLDIVLFGVSADSPASHTKFKNKFTLPFPLLSDESHAMLEAYGVWGLKKFMGREYMGVSRTTVSLNPDHTISHIWTEVKPKGHAEEVMTHVSANQ